MIYVLCRRKVVRFHLPIGWVESAVYQMMYKNRKDQWQLSCFLMSYIEYARSLIYSIRQLTDLDEFCVISDKKFKITRKQSTKFLWERIPSVRVNLQRRKNLKKKLKPKSLWKSYYFERRSLDFNIFWDSFTRFSEIESELIKEGALGEKTHAITHKSIQYKHVRTLKGPLTQL